MVLVERDKRKTKNTYGSYDKKKERKITDQKKKSFCNVALVVL